MLEEKVERLFVIFFFGETKPTKYQKIQVDFSGFFPSKSLGHEKTDTQKAQMSNEKNLGWLGYIGDYTTQLYRDYNKPL